MAYLARLLKQFRYSPLAVATFALTLNLTSAPSLAEEILGVCIQGSFEDGGTFEGAVPINLENGRPINGMQIVTSGGSIEGNVYDGITEDGDDTRLNVEGTFKGISQGSSYSTAQIYDDPGLFEVVVDFDSSNLSFSEFENGNGNLNLSVTEIVDGDERYGDGIMVLNYGYFEGDPCSEWLTGY